MAAALDATEPDPSLPGSYGAVTFEPIGYVKSDFSWPDKSPPGASATAQVVLDPAHVGGLTGLEPGDEVLVIFWFHLSSGYELLQHPRGDETRPKRGVFALRSPHRPNPIGITKTRITAIRDNVLTVTDLDAFDGTPVLDIKPA